MTASARPGRPPAANSAAAAIKQAAQPRRHEVEQIVEPRRGPAEAAVARRPVADHAVERVRHLVGEEAGQPEQQVPERRRHDAVAEILGEALDRGAGDAVPRRGSPGRGRRCGRTASRPAASPPPIERQRRPRRHARTGCAARPARRSANASTAAPARLPRHSSCNRPARAAPAPPTSTTTVTMPRPRRAASLRISRLSLRSKKAMARPASTTGCGTRANTAGMSPNTRVDGEAGSEQQQRVERRAGIIARGNLGRARRSTEGQPMSDEPRS